MTDLSFDDLFEPEDIDEAISYLETRKDSCGIDGIYLSELREYWLVNGYDILELLRTEKYNPGIVRNTEIVNYKGKKRTISLFNSIDRLILRCMSQNIQAVYDAALDEHCFAYRTGYGIGAAVSKESDYLEEGFLWTVKVDISSYFDSIILNRLEKHLRQIIVDDRIFNLICKYLHVNIEEDGRLKRKERGLIQGSSLSPFLSNLYLEPFDRKMTEEGMRFCRFGDDMIFNFESVEKAEEHLGKARELLKSDFGLLLNEEKSGVFEGLDQKYLGYRFRKDRKNGRILATRKEKKHDVTYYGWNRNAIHKTDRNYHIINDGLKGWIQSERTGIVVG